MKVGTDGVLLGAWADFGDAGRILDLGCGSGLIALMAAQRTAAHIVGVELDVEAARQAAENVDASPFAGRIEIVCSDIRNYSPEEAFDCIVSNPPFFEEDLLPPDAGRAAARHTKGLGFEALIANTDRLLRPSGSFCVVLPHEAARRFTILCAAVGLNLERHTAIVTVPGKAPKRSLMAFRKEYLAASPIWDTLPLADSSGQRSAELTRLTADFYL